MSEIHTGDCTKILEELLHKYEWGSYKFFELMQKLCIAFEFTNEDCYHHLMEYPFTGNTNRAVCAIIIMDYTNKMNLLRVSWDWLGFSDMTLRGQTIMVSV